MSFLWGWISHYVWAGAAVVAAALLLALGVQTHRVKIAKAETAQVKVAWAAQREQATAAAMKAQTEYRAIEAQMQAQSEKSYRDYQAAQSRNESALAAARDGTDKLRSQLAAYASGSGQAAPDSIAAASERAARLGELLASALRADAEHASAAESNGDAVRALLAAWPHQDATP